MKCEKKDKVNTFVASTVTSKERSLKCKKKEEILIYLILKTYLKVKKQEEVTNSKLVAGQ